MNGDPCDEEPIGTLLPTAVRPTVENLRNVSVPLVTVVLPVFNGGKYLRLAVLSIVRQSFTNWELLLIDDGSTDNSISTISDIKDDRIRLISDGRNRGLVVRLNQAIDLARGTYFARMDADDVSHQDRFVRQVAALQSNPSLDLVAVRAYEMNEASQLVGFFPFARSHREICARPWLGFHMLHPTWMGRLQWFRKYRYSIPAPFLCEDQELLLRSYRASQFLSLDEFLFGYRVRTEIDWKRMCRTRHAVWDFQVHQFWEKRQWYFMLLATAAYFLRVMHDYSKRYDMSITSRNTKIVPAAAVGEWESIIKSLL